MKKVIIITLLITMAVVIKRVADLTNLVNKPETKTLNVEVSLSEIKNGCLNRNFIQKDFLTNLEKQ